MAPKRTSHVQAKVIAVSTKGNYRRSVPKTYSYRYEVVQDAGPANDPLVRAGAAIIDGRYRGRTTAFNISRSMIDDTIYRAEGSYVHPLEDNPMAYPPRHMPAEEKHIRTPGFAVANVPKIVRPAAMSRIDSNLPPDDVEVPLPGSAAAQLAAAPKIGATARREQRRATSANEPAFRKTG